MEKKKILVVDDDVNLNTVLVDKLNIHGFEATGAMDGEAGLEKALKEHPDLILLDILMPKMGGLDVLKKLREDAWGKDVKVIMLTLLDQANTVASAVESNATGYLVKTDITLDDMITKVENVFK